MTDDTFELYVPRHVRPRPAVEPSDDLPFVEPAPAPAGESLRHLRHIDDVDFSGAVRERAVQIAAHACARALGVAAARNPLFVARFVDDALRAAGHPTNARAILNPGDARACAGVVRCDIVADGCVNPGELILETPDGQVRASISERAALLARASVDE